MVRESTGLQERAREGDAAAFGELIRMWDRDLRGVAWSVVRTQTDTDDVMQRAYEKAFVSLTSFNGTSSLKTWLHSICYRTALDHVRYENRRRHDGVETLEVVPAVASTDGAAMANLELDELLERLPDEQRVLLMLTAGLGYSFDETAEITGLARGTVASRISRARANLDRWSSDVE